MREYQAAFNFEEETMGRTTLVKHCIDTEDQERVYKSPQFIPYGVEAETQALLDQGRIKGSSSECIAQ